MYKRGSQRPSRSYITSVRGKILYSHLCMPGMIIICSLDERLLTAFGVV